MKVGDSYISRNLFFGARAKYKNRQNKMTKKSCAIWWGKYLIKKINNTLSVKKSALILVGKNFSNSPIKIIENKGFENFSRQKF